MATLQPRPGRLLCIVVLIVFTLEYPTETLAQFTYHSDTSSRVVLSGTSTLHDWKMISKAVDAEARFRFSMGELDSVLSVTVRLAVASLKGKNDAMNTNAWETLNYMVYPNIELFLTSVKVVKTGIDRYRITSIGRLTIAGTTKDVSLVAHALFLEDGSVVCTGMLPIKFTQFNLDPPSFMLGAMKVGNSLNVVFKLRLLRV